MTEETRRPGRKQVLLRLDPAVHDALAAWAAGELRSTNAQIEYLLRRALADTGRLPSAARPIPRRGRPPRSGEPRDGQPPERQREGSPGRAPETTPEVPLEVPLETPPEAPSEGPPEEPPVTSE